MLTQKDVLSVLFALAYVGIVAAAAWRVTRPRRVCGPACKHPDDRIAGTDYTICRQCPVRGLCEHDKPCEQGG